MANPKQTLYEILELPRDASEQDIRLAYQRRTYELQREEPPNANAIALVKEAHDILSNPKRRAAYDATLSAAADRAAAAGQATDFVVEADEEPARSKKWIPLAFAAVAILVIAIFALRPARTPAPTAAAPEPAAAPKPEPPPPPKALTAEQLLQAATFSSGQVMSYEMSGRAVPIGLALAIEREGMITTCHGIPANAQLVVRYGKETHSATLTVTDEVLDLCKLAVTGMFARPVQVAADEAKAGEKIFVLGANAKGELALTEGTVKQTRMAQNVKVLELSMPVAPNGSGAPVYDEFGRLVGVATTPHRYGPNISAAISSGWISQMRTRDRPQPQ